MTHEDLITAVNDRRRDTTNDFVSSTEITRYLNEALSRIQAKYDWEFTVSTGAISYVNGTLSYDLATSLTLNDNKSPISLEAGTIILNANNVKEYEFTMVNQRKFTSLMNQSLNMFSLVGNTMYIKTSFGTSSLLYTYYSKFMAVDGTTGDWKLKLVATDDYPLIPEEYQPILIDYAAARCFQKEGLLEDYNIAIGDYKNGLKEMEGAYPKRTIKPLRSFVMGDRFNHYDSGLSKNNLLAM